MAENSGFWSTSGTPAGHQTTSYTQANWSTAAEILAACSGFEGVAPGYKNELVGAYISANHVHIGTGGAVVDGKWYINDAEAGVTIPSAGGGTTRKDRIVLRCTWADFHTELTVLTGDASDYPAITQTSGTTYDITLYKALVNDAGVVTLTDERIMASPFKYRQGGNATDWTVNGSTNYSSAGFNMQMGVTTLTITAGNYTGNVVVTYPSAFSNKPVPFLGYIAVSGTGYVTTLYPSSITSTTFVFNVSRSADTGTLALDLSWIAFGPK